MDKLKMQSENLVDGNVEKIASLFPNCVTESMEDGKLAKKVDFDLLRQELSNVLVEGKDERYRLDWAGKRQAILTANSPIAKTLRPCREESVQFDTTENLYIEGDNLDVLKLLHETYLNKIKMIYIDPPYNTGNDFVYNDDFAEDAEEYMLNSNQIDEQRNRMTTNKETSGRYHSDWLSMMYMRLKLAKDLLTDDGAIFISIDDNEQSNLKKICDEIFGEDNFLAQFIWHKKTQPSFLSKEIALVHEYILVYKKNNKQIPLKGGFTDINRTSEMINIGNPIGERYLPKENVLFENGDFNGLLRSGIYGNGVLTVELLKDINIIEGKSDSDIFIRSRIVQSQKTINDGILSGWQIHIKSVKSMRPTIDKNLKEAGIKPPISLLSKKLSSEIPTNTDASSEIKKLFNGINIMDYPKPINLIKYLTGSLSNNDDIILDFFSGSATAAHAVMQLNAEDGGNRKFIMVQLPELTDEKSEAYKAGYKNICEIGKERIRRAGNKIAEENRMTAPNLDIGFRVLKLNDSNMKDVYYNPKEYNQSMLLGLDSSIKEDRTAEDILFQVMLDKGVLLSSKIEKRTTANGQNYFIVGETGFDIIDLICCLDKKVNTEAVKEIAKLQPECCVFLDSGIEDDATRNNIQQIFTTYSPKTKVEVL